MINSVKTQHKQYELSLLPKILNSKNFFICFLNEQHTTDFFELKQFCVKHNIKLQIFKNNIVKLALKKTNWSILNQSVFGPIVIGYNLTNQVYSPQELEQIFKYLLQNKSIGFLSGFFYPMLTNQAILTDLINYNKNLLNGIQMLNSLKYKIASNLFFYKNK
jgi:hypothetical protein